MRSAPPAVDLLLRARLASSPGRAASWLVEVCVRDGRVQKALCGMLEENPFAAAECLRGHGDRDAIPALIATLDRLPPLPHGGPGERDRCDAIVGLVQAIHGLGGRISKGQATTFDAAWERGGGPPARGRLGAAGWGARRPGARRGDPDLGSGDIAGGRPGGAVTQAGAALVP